MHLGLPAKTKRSRYINESYWFNGTRIMCFHRCSKPNSWIYRHSSISILSSAMFHPIFQDSRTWTRLFLHTGLDFYDPPEVWSVLFWMQNFVIHASSWSQHTTTTTTAKFVDAENISTGLCSTVSTYTTSSNWTSYLVPSTHFAYKRNVWTCVK